MTINRKLADHLGGNVRRVHQDQERAWQMADARLIRQDKTKYERPGNMRMSKWGGAEGVKKMRQGGGART